MVAERNRSRRAADHQGLPDGRGLGAGPAGSTSSWPPASSSSCSGPRAAAATLLNILGGLDAPTSGEVVYRDHNLTTAGEAASPSRRDHVGFVFQFYNLIPSLTARENVAW